MKDTYSYRLSFIDLLLIRFLSAPVHQFQAVILHAAEIRTNLNWIIKHGQAWIKWIQQNLMNEWGAVSEWE